MEKSPFVDKILQVVQEFERDSQERLEASEKRVSALEEESEELRAELEAYTSVWGEIADEVLRDRLDRLGLPHLDTLIREAGVILEDRLRQVAGDAGATLHGVALVDAVFSPSKGKLTISPHQGEQQGVMMLYRGAMQFIRNPPMHKPIEYSESTARIFIRLIDSLLELLSEVDRKRPGTPEWRQWDEESFLEELRSRQGADETEVAKLILEWAKANMPSIWWGQGTKSGGFIPGLNHKGKWHQLIEVWTYGRVELQFQYMKKSPPFDTEDGRLELLRRFNGIPDVYVPEDAINRRPSIRLSVFKNRTSLEQFLDTLCWAVNEILAN